MPCGQEIHDEMDVAFSDGLYFPAGQLVHIEAPIRSRAMSYN